MIYLSAFVRFLCFLMAASSSSAPSFPSFYDVFLCFRGKDTRTTFTDHLYAALAQAGIHTFRDDDEIERGEDIKKELDKAIQQSKVAVIVFSSDYASSRWCLDELVQINEQRKTRLCHILPIFYHMEPSEVRWQEGSFGTAFSKLKERYKEELEIVHQWKDVLKEIADLSGKVLKAYQYEASFIQNIVKLVLMKLDRKLLYEEPYLVGIDSYVNDINKWLEDESTDVRILIVHGIGGVGKTTIAKTVYNKNNGKFEKCSFLQNVGETSKQPNGVHSLQEQILHDMGRSQKIYNTEEGVIKINDATCCRKVLIVLDDLDDSKQFKEIIGHREHLPLRSKIIITTRNMSLLNRHESFWKLKIWPLCDYDSFQLFNWHAFKGNSPPRELFDHSKSAVRCCGGLPLALTVSASFLCRLESIDLWESAIKEMQTIPMGEVQKILKLSFDSLENDKHKQLFLHIACFFTEMDEDEVVTILDGCGFHTLIGIQHLIDRCLVDRYLFTNKLTMHQLVRDMGREIVRQESEEPGKRSRIWNHQEAFDILTEGTGTKNIKGFTLDLHILKENYSSENSLERSVAPCDSLHVEAETLKKMCNLQLLQLNNVGHVGSIVNFPKNLVWLCWHGFPSKYLPATGSHGRKLVVLDMRYSSLHHLFQETLPLPRLKILNLSNSDNLITTPDFNILPNLERLILKNCSKLVMIHESIGVLERLVVLNLNGCIKLRNLPRTIGHLKALQELYLGGCTELSFPKEMVYMEKLEEFDADGITLQEVNQQSALGLVSRGATKLNQFSLAFLPSSLTELSLGCSNLSDNAFSGNLRLPFLKILDLKGNIFHTLPDEIFKGFPSLFYLDLSECRNLIALPDVPESLDTLHLDGCQSITKLPDTSSGDGFTFDVLKEEDIAMIHKLKLFHKHNIQNFELEMLSVAARMIITTPVKALQEHGIFSIFQPGNEIPSWYKYQEVGDEISLILEDKIINALNICIVYKMTKYAYLKTNLDNMPFLTVRSRTRLKYTPTVLVYKPAFFAVGVSGGEKEGPPEACNNMLWLSSWNVYNVLNAGDKVEVRVSVVDRCSFYFKVKRIGVDVVVKQEWDNYPPTLRSLLPPGLSQKRLEDPLEPEFVQSFASMSDIYKLKSVIKNSLRPIFHFPFREWENC